MREREQLDCIARASSQALHRGDAVKLPAYRHEPTQHRFYTYIATVDRFMGLRG